ncbi:MAG: hemerythrin domain-containing protein [Candidatus Omnitrophica bacterium]|nr:hemerythrin domain-containing protein [Candidatus Omnitrophota bacterium]
MTIIEKLSVEHGVFLKLLDYLEKLKGDRSFLDVTGLKHVIFVIANVVEKHAEHEEKFLFPKLRSYIGPELNRIQAVEFEHGEIRKILAVIKKNNDLRAVRLEAAKLITFLRDHIAKEESVLFPVAEQCLNPEHLQVPCKSGA